jgi:predicted lysophospholipase L1 biosynthesis ABC-type transport system permease subunit
VLRELALPAGVRAADPDEAAQRVSNVSRAYRVNLTVLALVALFTGAFLVFSILSLSVAQRQPQLALLGVLGLSARERLRLVLVEAALLGAVGSAAGLARRHRARRARACACSAATSAAATSPACRPSCSSARSRRWCTARSASPPRSSAAGCRRARPDASRRRRA